MFRTFPCQKVKGWDDTGSPPGFSDVHRMDCSKLCRVHSVAPCLIDRIASYIWHKYIHPMRQQCVAHHFKVKWSKFKVTWIVRCFCCVRFVAACYLTDLLKYNPLLGQKPRSKFKVTRDVEDFFVSAPWCLFIRIICGTNTILGVMMCRIPLPGQKVKVQGHVVRSEFLPCSLHGSMPICLIRFIWIRNTTHGHEVTSDTHHFPVQMSKVNNTCTHIVRSYKVLVFGS